MDVCWFVIAALSVTCKIGPNIVSGAVSIPPVFLDGRVRDVFFDVYVKKIMIRKLRLALTSAEATIWDLSDGEVVAALDSLLERQRGRRGNCWEVDFRASRMGRWDQAYHVEALLDAGFPAEPQVILYFPMHKRRDRQILRVNGMSSTGPLQKEIHARLQASGDAECKLVVYVNDSDWLFACVGVGSHVEVRWASKVGTSLGRIAEVTLRPECICISEQDGYSNTKAMFLLTGNSVSSDVDGYISMKSTDLIKWPVGERMTANARPGPLPPRRLCLETEAQARYSIGTMGQRALGALRERELFQSSDEEADEEEEGDDGDGDDDTDDLCMRFDEAVFLDEAVEMVDVPRLVVIDHTAAVKKPLGVKSIPLTGSIAYDSTASALAESGTDPFQEDDDEEDT